jgi:hypothetical protein
MLPTPALYRALHCVVSNAEMFGYFMHEAAIGSHPSRFEYFRLA